MINFSIIIPHYNIPDLLMRCLMSIPVREDIQVIVVDDCSPCQEDVFRMLERLNRPYLEYYTTPIGGSAGRARNIGLDHAKGKWLIFADADDFFVVNFEQILDEHVGDAEDIVYFLTDSVDSGNINIKRNRHSYFNKLVECDGDVDGVRTLRSEHTVPWGKIIKANLVRDNNIWFEPVRYSNDVYFAISCGCLAKTIKNSLQVLYIVTNREGSLTSAERRSEKEKQCRTEVYFRTQKVICENGYNDRYRFVSIAMRDLLLEDSSMFVSYFRRLKKEPYSRLDVFLNLWNHPNKRIKIRLLLCIIKSFLI